jgi:hypothetical protein
MINHHIRDQSVLLAVRQHTLIISSIERGMRNANTLTRESAEAKEEDSDL